MYDPGYKSDTQTKQVEPDYETLILQHAADLAAQPNPRQILLDALDNATNVAQVKAAVKDLLK